MGRGLGAARRSRPGDPRRQRRGRARRHAAERPRAPLPRRARDAPSADRRAGVAGGPRRGGRAGRAEGRAMRTAVVFGGLLCCVAVSVIVGALVGAVPLGPGEVLGAIGGHGDPGTLAIVRDLRLPRVVGAALIGGALAVAGTLLQGLLRNPLADPYVTGTSAGASLGAVATIVIGATAPFVLPFGAFAGAILAVAVTWRLAALGGVIGFVGLVVPHALRPLVGALHRRLVPAAFLAGAATLVLADAGARSVLAPSELPVGVITGAVGGPFFLALLLREQRRMRV